MHTVCRRRRLGQDIDTTCPRCACDAFSNVRIHGCRIHRRGHQTPLDAGDQQVCVANLLHLRPSWSDMLSNGACSFIGKAVAEVKQLLVEAWGHCVFAAVGLHFAKSQGAAAESAAEPRPQIAIGSRLTMRRQFLDAALEVRRVGNESKLLRPLLFRKAHVREKFAPVGGLAWPVQTARPPARRQEAVGRDVIRVRPLGHDDVRPRYTP